MIRKLSREVTVHLNRDTARIKIMINERTPVFIFDVKWIGKLAAVKS